MNDLAKHRGAYELPRQEWTPEEHGAAIDEWTPAPDDETPIERPRGRGRQ